MNTQEWIDRMEEEGKILSSGTLNLIPVCWDEDDEDERDAAIRVEVLGSEWCGKREPETERYLIGNRTSKTFFEAAEDKKQIPYFVVNEEKIPGNFYRTALEKRCKFLTEKGIKQLLRIKTNDKDIKLDKKESVIMYTSKDGKILFNIK